MTGMASGQGMVQERSLVSMGNHSGIHDGVKGHPAAGAGRHDGAEMEALPFTRNTPWRVFALSGSAHYVSS